MKKTLKYVLAASILVGGLSTLSSCGWENPGQKGVHTYNTYTTISPSNWNELSYQDANDTQIMSYIGSSFFGYDFKFDANGEIIPGEFEVTFEAATALEDVTATYAGNEKYAVPAGKTKNYAYKITLREDLKWDDGTSIKASDFVYTMKEQLNPLFKHYRADSFYNGSTIIHGAKDYVFQGSSGHGAAYKYASSLDTAPNLKFNWDTSYYADYYAGSYTPEWLLTTGYGVLPGMTDEECRAWLDTINGKPYSEIVESTDENVIALLTWWFETDDKEVWKTAEDLLYITTCDYQYPEYNFDDVGIFAQSDYELVVVLDSPLDLLKEDGTLSYKAAYNFASLPLVKEDVYEANKVAPVEGASLWTSTYNSSVESTASWGPYKLTYFQSGKQYVLERNENWYGYGLAENEGLYQTDRIVCDTIEEWNTAWLAFQKGEVTSIGIDVSIATDYKSSSRAIYTPDDYVGSMQLQSDKEALAGREEAGVDKEILGNAKFRKAISLAINRTEYNKSCTTASKSGFGLFNSMHYYDVANGGVYRNTDEGKKVLCDVYGVDVNDYASLDEAEAAITGYDLTQAKALVEEAYQEELLAGTISETDVVKLTFGTGAINESTNRIHSFLDGALKEMVKGTSLEGRLETTIEDHGDKWANDFRDGAYDICLGGWSGAAWDPGYFLLAYLSPDYMYSVAWDTSTHPLTYTVKGVTIKGVDGEDIVDPTLTMSMLDWYDCLNGATTAPYDWSEGAVANEVRLGLIAALEREILLQYYTVPMQNYYSASLLSYKVEYITEEYNTFMSYGGIKYMTYNYDDYDWAQYNHDNKVDYKA